MFSNPSRLLCLLLLLLANVNCLPTPRVVVIGAGAAGVAAATQLHKRGLKNVTVLEAEGRIGGRIYSVPLGQAYLDLGAQWCHGEQNNLVYSLVEDLKILKGEDLPSKLYHSRLGSVDEAFAESLASIIHVAGAENDFHLNLTVGEYLTGVYQKAVSATWQSEPLRKLAEECLEVFHKQVLAENGAPSWFNISTEDDYEVCPGNQELSWGALGYKTILEVLLQAVPDFVVTDRILLNKEVVAVNCSEITCEVTCSDGTSYTCDQVIFTGSLGVLKENQVRFTPELTGEKAAAIRTLGFGAVAKIFLHYSTRWWNDDFPGAIFVWDKEDLAKQPEEGRPWTTGALEIIPVLGIPNVLSLWCVGEFVPEIETASNETIVNGVMYLLKTFLGEAYPNVTAPDEILRHNWYSDPHFRGTYSFNTVESQILGESQRAALSKPVLSPNGSPRVLFAGEATNSAHYATVHGAIESGFREADRLALHYGLSA